MAQPQLEFLKNDAGETEGLADAGIETFRDAPYASCAREAGQNSRDAFQALPVRMTFNVISLPQGQFPGHKELLTALRACAETAGHEKEREFFQNALSVATRPYISVLEVADYNTKGLTGPPDQAGTPFHSLVKAAGVSTKDSETSGGSFGIGKNASFAVSDLQMVFYSTCYVEEAMREVFAAQGKIRLVSHTDEHDQARRATGYWGDRDRYRAVTDTDVIPVWMQRNETGTSIFCMGFRESEDWAEHITASLISNFFAAVRRGEMVFEVDNGRFQINSNTLEGLLSSPDVKEAADKSGHQQDLEFADQLLRCIVSPNSVEHLVSIEGLGDVRIRVLVENDMPKRVGFIRNGMLITDNLHHFGQPLQRFPASRDFVAVVEPADDAAGKLLKRLENPAHDNFSAQRIADPAKRTVAEVAMRKLAKKLRELIKATTGVEQQDSMTLDELAQFFADPKKADAPPDPNADHDPETYRFRPPEVQRRPKAVRAPELGEDGGSGRKKGSTGAGSGAGPFTGSGSGGTGQQGGVETIQLSGFRNLIRPDSKGAARSRLLFFNSTVEGEVRIRLQANGVNTPEPLAISEAASGMVEGGALTMRLSPGKRYSVLVTLDEPYDGPVELIARRLAPVSAS